ncbi:TldD/PmbA family protein [Rhizobacter sp. AJA081-3]|uniref:TldD/PmbA family protein n=1 Tax=Rhizobacter sp. AJA081-3 TaxID=2753607 RepID=UPI001ADF5520|nr:TldD/PmbA family protein [Rhizobacter sp. AJA081-3]QTN24985.1 TldD/PmbA family protein [Rhizobacter sp. AJA081-3]
MFDALDSLTQRVAPADARWTLRAVDELSETLTVRQDVAEAPQRCRDTGVMVSVSRDGGLGHAATADLSEAGLADAFVRAGRMARAVAGRMVFDPADLPAVTATGRYEGVVRRPLQALGLGERLALLREVCAQAGGDSRIVDRVASLLTVQFEQLLLTSDGGRSEQRWSQTMPHVQATAHVGGVTQTRSSAGQYNGWCQQGGLEVLERARFATEGARVAAEAIELAMAPPCPGGTMDVLLMPDQMMLQIHESIGHPLELDRILGDERNFAGTSFVTLDMFGHYAYGSELLNVTYDPTRPEQIASFGFDDEGEPAQRRHLIENGILKRPLGGAVSLARARTIRPDLEGVATARASSWNRAPIDRMSNLNIEPGTSTLDEMIASIEHGVMLHTNVSWSIDDSRNKFQFGCESGRMIRHGKLAELVRDPSYRGISATFWRSLAMVGDEGTFEVMGTPYCGKGEPSQMVRVGHAAPACKFSRVAVVGSAA